MNSRLFDDMLIPSEIKAVKKALDESQQPLFFFHDDPDGLASYLLCYRYVKRGRGMPIKAYPRITFEPYARKVTEFGPDHVFVLDIAMMDQEFIDAVKTPITWVDHHAVQQRERVKYCNPQLRGVNIPTPELIWQVIGAERSSDLWIATTGAIGDWHYPDFAPAFSELEPAILPPTANTVQEALFNTPLGTLVKVFSFNLKGQMNDVHTSVKILARIEHPNEILQQTTPGGAHLWRKYLTVNKQYEILKKEALKFETKDKMFVWTYEEDSLSLTKDLANELLYLFKDKVVILGRRKDGEYRCSLRAPAGVLLGKALEKALVGVQGYGGGHEQACGCAVKEEDWKRFLENLRRELRL